MTAAWEKYDAEWVAAKDLAETEVVLYKLKVKTDDEAKALETAALAESSRETTASLEKEASDAAAKVSPAAGTTPTTTAAAASTTAATTSSAGVVSAPASSAATTTPSAATAAGASPATGKILLLYVVSGRFCWPSEANFCFLRFTRCLIACIASTISNNSLYVLIVVRRDLKT